jgi:esterase/lipase
VGKRLKAIEKQLERLEHEAIYERVLELETENVKLTQETKELKKAQEEMLKSLARANETLKAYKDTTQTLTNDLADLKLALSVYQGIANELKELNQKQAKTNQIFSEWLYGAKGDE